ncbi:MAG: hypothetical protein KF861_00445 [Planctomycetaceae bacterium]|nr:hypothetical protein [Planctomycetaceae bacterium]
MRNILTTILEIFGAAAIVAGVWLFSIPIALIIGGVILIGFSYLVVRR